MRWFCVTFTSQTISIVLLILWWNVTLCLTGGRDEFYNKRNIIHCKVSEWSEWGLCSKTCGHGRRVRFRKIIQAAARGGRKCPNLKDRQSCNAFQCQDGKQKDNRRMTENIHSSCCVCGVAIYRATFVNKWNKTSHPNDYPERLASFSNVIGGTHADGHSLWELGSKASQAVKRFTEWGDTRSLMNKSSRRNYLGIIRIGPIAKINKPISDRFRADKHNHYLSMISKIKPSPDWFVGIDRFDLCNASTCKWKTNITIQLTPYDAGTDSGLKFKSKNILSKPAQDIYKITPNVPNHPSSSFFDEQRVHIPPMAEFKIDLIHTKKKRCSRNTDPDVPCLVSRWSSWTPCSMMCGRGKKTRTRRIIQNPQNRGRACPKLTRSKSCRGRNCTNIDCKVSKWSTWSKCTKICGKEKRTRSRKVLVPPKNDGKKCPPLKTRAKCRIPKRCPVVHCKVSEWSGWGLCSKTCGHGIRIRTREMIKAPSRRGRRCPNLEERQICNAFVCRGLSKLSSISGK
ncbi:spondin-1-like [Xenia sp. Carnegie-2017]|uniref:spondin-1-like n=1 Tax=Xenia sp. Carnegie-2017 TaxID=2897299 RepID=UPI001F04ACFC|nr:spondin-1-like [Xenia sp. Carnegie-2017]